MKRYYGTCAKRANRCVQPYFNSLKHFKHLTLRVIFPLLVGGLIYIIFRSEKLFMFRWFEDLRLSTLIAAFRKLNQLHVPAWTIYSLPDALWIFAFTNLMLMIWQDKVSLQSIVWILLAPLVGIGSEIGQGLHVIEGTFDLIDFVLIIIALTLAFSTSPNNFKAQLHETKKTLLFNYCHDFFCCLSIRFRRQ